MRSPRCLVAYGADTAFIDPLIYIYIIYKRSFYQDRLGTSIGKVEEKGRFLQGLWAVPDDWAAVRRSGAKRNHLIWFFNFLISKPITCQDRLGTNVTKCAERRDRFVHGCHRQEYGGGFVYEGDHTGGEIRTAAESAHPPWQDDAIMVTNHNMVQKNRLCPTLYPKNDHFAKTGSGQT